MADCSIIWTYQYWNSTTPKNYSIVCKYQVTHACHYVGLALVGSVPPWRSSHQSHPYHTSTQRPTVNALGIERQVDEDAQPWQMTHKWGEMGEWWNFETNVCIDQPKIQRMICHRCQWELILTDRTHPNAQNKSVAPVPATFTVKRCWSSSWRRETKRRGKTVGKTM